VTRAAYIRQSGPACRETVFHLCASRGDVEAFLTSRLHGVEVTARRINRAFTVLDAGDDKTEAVITNPCGARFELRYS